MSDLELNSKKTGSTPDPGKARMRKLKREERSLPPEWETKPTRARREVRKSIPGTGPSKRESLVDRMVKVQPVSMTKIQEKLELKKIPSLEKITHNLAPRRVEPSPEKGPRSSRRKESRHSESLYEAGPHTESQRKTETRPGYLPKVSRRTFEARSESAPPVMVRGGLGGMAFGRIASSKLSKRKAPRRRIDVPLNVPGAEVRLPSIPLLHVGWRAASFFMVVLMIASLVLIWKSPTFKISSIKTEGLQRLTLTDLNAVMRISGKSIFTIDPKTVDEALEQAFPELSKISIKINLPASVKVTVNERQPVIAWIQDNKETWVDVDGVSFPARGTISDTLVKVEGYGTPPGLIQTVPTGGVQNASIDLSAYEPVTTTIRLSTDLVTAILELGAQMPPDTLLVYDSEHGLGWNDPKGWDVFFGAEDQDMQMKLAVYQSLVERLESEGIQPALISVEYVHAPYYRMQR